MENVRRMGTPARLRSSGASRADEGQPDEDGQIDDDGQECPSYLEAPDLFFQENTHTISVDEMPGVQTLAAYREVDSQSGRPERSGSEYKRHGTL